MIYLDLFLGFLHVGCFSFGGAYAAIPLIRDTVLSYGWMTEDELSYMIAVSESTPGSIMVNLATYVGSKQAGLPGAALATLSVVLPSFFIILFLLGISKSAMKNPCMQAFLKGISPCVTAVILATGLHMITNVIFPSGLSRLPELRSSLLTVVLATLMFASRPLFKRQLSSIGLILLAAAGGVLIYS